MLALEAPAATEAMAYGNAPYLYSQSSSLLFYSPGLIERAEGVEGSLQTYGGDGTLASIAGAGSVFGGGFAVGVQYMRYGTDEWPLHQDLQSIALSGGELGVTEFVGTVGYAQTIFGIEAGATLKYLEQSVNLASVSGVAFDFGLAGELGPVMISLAGRNFGGDLDLSGEPVAQPPAAARPDRVELPQQLIAGASVEDFELGPLDLLATTQVMRRRDGEFIPAGGVELSYWPVVGYTFRLRGGLQRVVEDDRSPVTFGAAFTGDHITIEYAFQSFDGEGNAHRFGIRWQ